MSAYSDLLAELGYTPGDRAYDLFLAALQSGFGKTAHEKPISVHDSSGFVAGYAADELDAAVAKAGALAGYAAESKIVKWSVTLTTGDWGESTKAITLVIDCGMGFKPSVMVTYATGVGAFAKAEQMSRLINEQCGKYGLRCGILGTSGAVTGIEIAAIDCMGFTATMNSALAALAGTPTVTTADVMDLPARTTSIAVTGLVNANSMTTSSDCTGIIRVGDKISFTNNSAAVVYHTVQNVSADGGDLILDRPLAAAVTAKTVTCHTPLNLRGPELRLGPGEYTGDVELFGGMRVIGTEAVFAGDSWKIMPGHKAHWTGIRFKPSALMNDTYRVDYVDGKVTLPELPKLGPRAEPAMSQAARVALLANSTNAQRMGSIAYWPLDRLATPVIPPATYCATKGVPVTIKVKQQGTDTDTSQWNAPAWIGALRKATRNAGWEVAAQQHEVTATDFTDILAMIREVLCPKSYIEQLSDSITSDAALVAEMPIDSEKSSDAGSYRPLGLVCRGFIPPARRGEADMDTLSSQESCSGFYGKLIREAYEWSIGYQQHPTSLPSLDMHPHGLMVEDYTANVRLGWLQSSIAAASWTKPDGATSAVAVGSDWRTAVAADGREYVKVGDYIGNDFHGWLEVSAVNETSITCTGQWETSFSGFSGTAFQLWNRTRMYEYLDTLSVSRRKSLLYAPLPLSNYVGHCFKAFVDKVSELSLAGTLVPVTVTTLINTQYPAADNEAASLAQDWDVDNWDAADPLPGAAGSAQYDYRFALRFTNPAHFAVVDDAGTHWLHMDDEAGAGVRKGVWVEPGRSYRWRWKMKDSAGDGSVLVHVSIGAALHRGDVWETVSKWHCLRHTKVTAVGEANYELVVGANGLLQLPEYAVNGLVKLEIWFYRNSGATDIRDLVLEYA